MPVSLSVQVGSHTGPWPDHPPPHHTRTPLPTPNHVQTCPTWTSLYRDPTPTYCRQGTLMWVSTVLITLNFRTAWSNGSTLHLLRINNKHKVVRQSHKHSLRLNISLLELRNIIQRNYALPRSLENPNRQHYCETVNHMVESVDAIYLSSNKGSEAKSINVHVPQ